MNKTPETDEAQHEGLLRGNAMPTKVVTANFARKLEQQRNEAKKELRQWQTLCLWGGTPEHIHDFIKGQQTRIHEAQDIEKTCEQLERERDEARERERVAITSWDEERQRALREGERVLEARRNLAEAQIECLGQARLLGMSSEKEAKLIYERDEWAAMCGRYKQERDEAMEALADWENAAAHVEADHPDEKHCGCVSVLRKLLDDARSERDEARKIASGLATQAERLRKGRDEAREDLEFRRGLYAQLCEAYKVKEEYLETARRERDEARAQIKELIYIAARAIDLADIDFQNDVSELQSDLDKIKEETK